MEHQLLKTLKSYEIANEELGITTNNNDKDSIRVLVNDINRTEFDFSRFRMHEARIRLYKNILYEALAEFPIKYVQGMAEVATVIVDVYFHDVVGEVSTEGINSSPALSVTNSGKKTFVYKEEEECKYFRKFIEDNKALLNRLRTSLVNVYQKKFLIFFKDNFRFYKECNEVFRGMMKRRGVKVNRDESFKYMNHVLTFFKRAFNDETTAYTIYRTILISEPTVLFSMLVIFWDNIQRVSTSSAVDNPDHIKSLPPNFMEKITLQQEVFMEVKGNLKRKSGSNGYLLFGVAASVLAIGVAAVYKFTDKD
ncbi:hypothetical protein PAEPH01_1484 [Pancytospora epiphaga]|nr:hypothetical protein PAEPH01_1484 [Pancytospora epiphaga]